MLTQNAPPEPLVRRFADDVARLTGVGSQARIGIAVSGGPDSLALLLLAAAAFPNCVEAATVDHGLRPAAADEALFVADLCESRGITHCILTLEGLPPGNISAQARKARYDALDKWMVAQSLDWLMTAHHADDQLETMIMRLNRGSGVAGLSGVRAKQGRIIRPLLHWRRDELAAVVEDAGILAINDPANRDDAYDRARLRKSLHGIDWIDAQAVALSADALVDADAALDWAVERLEAAHVHQDGAGISFNWLGAACPAELVRRLTLRCLQRIDPDNEPRGVPLLRFIAALENGGTAMLGNVIARGGDHWHFSAAPPRRTHDPQ